MLRFQKTVLGSAIMTSTEKQKLRTAVQLMSASGDCHRAWAMICELAGYPYPQPWPPFDQEVITKQAIERNYACAD
jgi:hypothetical protein